MCTNVKNSMHSRCLFIKLISTVLLMHGHDTKSEKDSAKYYGFYFRIKFNDNILYLQILP